MYCRNCGNLLHDNDKFCSSCGEKVMRVERKVNNDEKKVGEEGTNMFEKPERSGSEKPVPTTPKLDFSWNLEGFPSTDNKKTDDIDFNWKSVMEEKKKNQRNKDIVSPFVSKRIETPEIKANEVAIGHEKGNILETKISLTDVLKEKKEEPKDEPMIEGKRLEEDLFKEMSATPVGEDATDIDKFYTYNKKNEQFQEILDKEYEKLRHTNVKDIEIKEEEDEDEKNEVPISSLIDFEVETKIDKELLDEFKKPKNISDKKEHEVKSFEDVIAEKEEQRDSVLERSTIKFVHKEKQKEQITEEVEPDQCPPSKEETEESQEPIKEEKKPEPKESREERKLSVNDVFPFSNACDEEDDEDDEEQPKKTSKALKIIIGFLVIVLIIELAFVGIKKFAPESSMAEKINTMEKSVMSIFDGKSKGKEAEAESSKINKVTEITDWIDETKDQNKNIGKVLENTSLKFEKNKDYGIEGIENAYPFTDSLWYENETKKVNYGPAIIGSVVAYNSDLVSYKNSENKNIIDLVKPNTTVYQELMNIETEEDVTYGMNSLEIGQILVSDNGFFVFTKIKTIDSKTNKETETKQIIYLEPIENVMKIADVKEF